jgi:hypothetical protein
MNGKPCVARLLLCVAAITAVGMPSAIAGDTLWHVKGVHPKGHLLDVVVVDAEGKTYEIKAIQEDDNVHMLDIKAIVGDDYKPVKVVASDDRYAPVMAIGIDGKNLDLKAVTPDGKMLDVKAIRRTGSILHIKVIGVGRVYGVKAVSPDGRMYDVKGVKMTPDRVEATIDNVHIHAHAKALPPAGDG